jgi:hypothetical protein
MSEEPFLARWARRKRDVAKSEAENAARALPEAKQQPDAPQSAAGAKKEIAAEEEAFDPASLPPIDSIVSGTDIRAFLAKNVPAELKHAALRRVWIADPTIRDFVGLAENDWDFTKPDSIPGFGELDPGFDVDAMVRRVMGEPDAIQEKVASAPVPSVESPAGEEVALVAQAEPDQNTGADESGASQASEPAASANEQHAGVQMVRRDISVAPQTEMTLRDHRNRRQHGGALPQEFTAPKRDS